MFAPSPPRLLWFAFMLCVIHAGAAQAETVLKLDRVRAQPSWFPNTMQLQIYVSAIPLRGHAAAVSGDKQWTLKLGNTRKRLPYLAGHYANTRDVLHVMLVIETAYAYDPLLARITEAAKEFVNRLPETARVGVIRYGELVHGRGRLSSKQTAVTNLTDTDADLTPSPNALIEAVGRAVSALRRAKQKQRQEPSAGGEAIRQLIIVISDGHDIDPTPQRYRDVAERADRHGIRIHTLGHSPIRHRAPMLGLGEMSKRSHGTFRLVLDTERSFHSNFRVLFDEIAAQYVLNYFVPYQHTVIGRRLRVEALGVLSNSLHVGSAQCGAQQCQQEQYCLGRCLSRNLQQGLGIIVWLGALGTGFAAILLLYVGVRYLRDRRGARASTRRASIGPGSAGGPVLFVIGGPYHGQTFPLRNGFVVGSAKKNGFRVMGDPGVAGEHVQFTLESNGLWYVTDLQNTTGTFVNGVRVTRKQLTSGMLIRVGKTEIRFLFQEQ